MRRLCVLLVVLIAPRLAAQETFLVSGTVSAPSGPVAGIPIGVLARAEFGQQVLLQTSVTTDAAGAFRVNVPRSRLNLSANPPPQLNLDGDSVFNVTVTRDITVRLAMAPAVTLSGEVIVPAGAPAPQRITIRSLTSDLPYGTHISGSRFEARVRAGVYSLQVSSANATIVGRTNVDATAGDVRNIVVRAHRIAEVNPFLISDSPRADRISLSNADESGRVTVTGAAGAVEPLSAVLVVNQVTGQTSVTASRGDGSFAAPIFAPPGSPIVIRHDPLGRFIPVLQVGAPNVSVNHAPGTTIYAPLPAGRFAGSGSINQPFESLQLSAARAIGVIDAVTWHLAGVFPSTPFVPGRQFSISGTLTIYARDVQTPEAAAALTVGSNTDVEQIFDGEGRQRRNRSEFVSTWMTPSGLPIERQAQISSLGPGRIGTLRLVRPGVIEAPWTLEGVLDPATPPGVYRTKLKVRVDGLPAAARHFDIFPVMGPLLGGSEILPPIRVGTTPPRLTWMLGVDHFTNGSRGAVALEDRGKVAISAKVMTSADSFIVTRGARMRLEPYLPLLSVTTGNGGTPEPPQVQFRLPSGMLTATVRKPDGSSETIGPAPFAALFYRTPISRSGESLTSASNHVSDFHQLGTADARFDYTFSQWGRHVITLDGNVEDIYGNVYLGGGTYEIDVARPIDFETGVIPGTPFTVDEALSTAVVLQPPIPATVTVTVRHYPNSDPAAAVTHEVRGFANRFGHFHGAPVRLGRPGEYRLDVQASWVAPDGVFWTGSATWGGVVETPDSRLVTRGRRGFDGVNRIQEQWLFVRQSRAGGDHLMFPFHRGDVMWMSKDDPAAAIPKIAVQDPDGSFAQRVRSNSQRPGAAWESPGIDERIVAGEIPLFSTLNRRSFDAPVQQWGYFYGAVSRPGVRVREFISEDSSGSGYWRFNDAYNLQLGNGIAGDLPNDFKFQFGGAVYRDLTDGFRYYGGYASFFVLLPMNDDPGGRLFPPFQGNGGGPSGGPLFRLKGRDIEMFLHPTAVRPGSVLQTHEWASFSGHVAPTLPAKIEIIVTSPSGRVRTIAGQAGKFGWFYRPDTDFRVDERGVWRARVNVVFDGVTSAGQVQAPYPTGNILGSREGEFYFYVVDRESAPLQFSGPSGPVRPADGPITFAVTPPPGLTNVEMHTTTTMPGFVLEESRTTALQYTYDAPRLARDFPNLDLHDIDGFAGADTITISLMLGGTDATGMRRYFARQIVLQGEDLQISPQNAEAPVRRRGVRP